MILQVGNKGHGKNGTLHNNCYIKGFLFPPKSILKIWSLGSGLGIFYSNAIQLVLIKKKLKASNKEKISFLSVIL